jgi:hypothetical protein
MWGPGPHIALGRRRLAVFDCAYSLGVGHFLLLQPAKGLSRILSHLTNKGKPLNSFNGCYEKPAKGRLKAPPEPVLTGF